jgi:hypothetical protein
VYAVVGTVPQQELPLVAGGATVKNGTVTIQGRQIPVSRGTPALLAAAITTSEFLGHPAPYAFLVGDTGLGDGSRRLYEYLAEHLREEEFQAAVFHYLQPDVRWHNHVLTAIQELPRRPILIADAGFMYAAKMSGQSQAYDLFTPDVGELAFLADEQAPHPFYTRGFILHEKNRVSELIARAYAHHNAPRILLVKGERDYVANRHGILATIDYPSEEAMEAIGGTGDTVTGMVTAMIGAGMEVSEAAEKAARANRLAGYYARPTVASSVMELVSALPQALEEVMGQKGKGASSATGTPVEKRLIGPDMTVLDVINRYRQTHEIFRRYDALAGECICCRSLFEPLQSLADKYGLHLETLLRELEAAAACSPRDAIDSPRAADKFFDDS